MATEDEKIAKLFNAGYLMQIYEPRLADKLITNNTNSNDYQQVLTIGIKQALKDNVHKQQHKSISEKKRSR